jgi:molybdate transport system permease protein
VDAASLRVSLALACWTGACLLPVGIVLGRWLAWGSFRAKSLVEAALMLPLVLPPTVLGYYLLIGLAPGALLGGVLTALAGQPLVFTFPGIVIASLIVNLPFAVQPMQRAFEAIEANVREAAWVCGLSPWQTFLKVELPLAWPGIVSAMALVFAHTLGEFGVILMVGGSIPGETLTLSIAIYDRVQAFRNAEAAAMAAALLAFSLAALAIVHTGAGRRPRAPDGPR